jgi:hypothetical protein
MKAHSITQRAARRRIVNILALCLVFFVCCTSDEARADKYALVVGIASYHDDRMRALPLCIEDVEATTACLVAHGFPDDHVVTMTSESEGSFNPTHINITARLRALAHRCKPGDLLLFYFSGHGFSENGKSYFTGTDTNLNRLSKTAVPIRTISDILQNSDASRVVCIVDACRAVPAMGLSKDVLNSDVVADAKRLVIAKPGKAFGLLLACSGGESAYLDPEARTSIFTEYFIKGLDGEAPAVGGQITASTLEAYLQMKVPQAAEVQGPQNPDGQFAGGIIPLAAGGAVDPTDSQATARTAMEPIALPPTAAENMATGNSLYYQAKYADAELYYTEAVRLEPANARCQYDFGRDLAAEQKYTDAEAYERAATRLEPTNAKYQDELGNDLVSQQRYADAEAIHREAIRLEPGNAQYQDDLGDDLFFQAKYADAEPYYREAVHLAPLNTQFAADLAGCIEQVKGE